MKKLGVTAYREIESFVYRNARVLEKAVWSYNFEGGDTGPILSALTYYQNGDGGFGNALEPDSWNPESTPYTTVFALNILQSAGFADLEHPLYKGILRYFNSSAHMTDNGWRFSIPSNNGYPRAPWWEYDENNDVENIGITAEISAFALQYADKTSALYENALKLSERLTRRMLEDSAFGEMGVGGFIVLAEALESYDGRGLYTAELQQRLDRLVSDSIERDTSKWQNHVVKPSRYIKSPQSRYYQANAEIVHTELDYLIDERPQGDVWGLDWSWFDNNEKFAREFAISENWWRAMQAVDFVKHLGAFDRL